MMQPETEHTVSVGKLQSWLDGGGKSPNINILRIDKSIWKQGINHKPISLLTALRISSG